MDRHVAAAHGLYAPDYEHDACGVSFVVDLQGRRSHRLVQQALTSLENLEHRGATGAEENTGDGAGILIGVPDRLIRAVVEAELPEAATTPLESGSSRPIRQRREQRPITSRRWWPMRA